jgi:NitT/TauT family transport system ATP-binding protein
VTLPARAQEGRSGGPRTIIDVSHVFKTFTSPDGSPLPVLEDITLGLDEDEIVALLGRSGSGKSTLLRCIAGLIEPTEGTISYRGEVLNGACHGVSMVFQSFALLPWLTVRQNVELGLEARGVAPGERRERAERAIDTIGLDGFESAYPKELSGGMRQRVGFARALVVEPDALLMDEPFSALDVLTSQNLRAELLRLWTQSDFPTKAMLIVTHNIEEAVILADRIFVLGANPGRIRAEIPVGLPQPAGPPRPGVRGPRRRDLRLHDGSGLQGTLTRVDGCLAGGGLSCGHAPSGGDRWRHGGPARDRGGPRR